MLRSLALFGIVIGSHQAYAQTNAEVLSTASKWLFDAISSGIPTDRFEASGDNCKIILKFDPTTSAPSAAVKPMLWVRVFDPTAFEIRSGTFYFRGGSTSSGDCKLDTANSKLLELSCGWDECEEQGCVQGKASMRVEKVGTTLRFETEGQSCIWSEPEVPS